MDIDGDELSEIKVIIIRVMIKRIDKRKEDAFSGFSSHLGVIKVMIVEEDKKYLKQSGSPSRLLLERTFVTVGNLTIFFVGGELGPDYI